MPKFGLKLGVDVGGTNVDFALVNEQGELLYGCKLLAINDLTTMILNGLNYLKAHYQLDVSKIDQINVGTTLALNSLLETKSLNKVGLIRLASHSPDFPPAYFWPEKYKNKILIDYKTISGGREYNNTYIQSFSPDELMLAAEELIAKGVNSIAIVSVFSPLYVDEELYVEKILSEKFDVPISLSHQLGGLGFIERENATLLNAALKNVLRVNFENLISALQEIGFRGPCFVTQNNGTLMNINSAIAFPVKTIASGATNSLVGAAKLAGCQDAIIVDIGGTSTDIGVVENGFPLRSLRGITVGGITCNLVAPNVVALSMGGGSIIRYQQNDFTIGPDSVGAKLFEQCKSNGGPTLTFHDIGMAIKHSSENRGIDIMKYFLQKIENTIMSFIPNAISKPILLVGGGADLIPDYLLKKNYSRPRYYSLANAYGAALAEISETIDCVLPVTDFLDEKINSLIEEAKNMACLKGADIDKLRIIDKKILPLHYMHEKMYRVMISVAG